MRVGVFFLGSSHSFVYMELEKKAFNRFPMGESSDWSQDNHCKLKTVGCSSFDSDLESVFSHVFTPAARLMILKAFKECFTPLRGRGRFPQLKPIPWWFNLNQLFSGLVVATAKLESRKMAFLSDGWSTVTTWGGRNRQLLFGKVPVAAHFFEATDRNDRCWGMVYSFRTHQQFEAGRSEPVLPTPTLRNLPLLAIQREYTPVN